jgi:hypothetical protein
MKPNVGTVDKFIRYAGAAILISLHMTGVVTGGLGYIALAVALVLLSTGIFSFCLLYRVFGLTTYSGSQKSPGKY